HASEAETALTPQSEFQAEPGFGLAVAALLAPSAAEGTVSATMTTAVAIVNRQREYMSPLWPTENARRSPFLSQPRSFDLERRGDAEDEETRQGDQRALAEPRIDGCRSALASPVDGSVGARRRADDRRRTPRHARRDPRRERDRDRESGECHAQADPPTEDAPHQPERSGQERGPEEEELGQRVAIRAEEPDRSAVEARTRERRAPFRCRSDGKERPDARDCDGEEEDSQPYPVAASHLGNGAYATAFTPCSSIGRGRWSSASSRA